jgi:hypothetical protein
MVEMPRALIATDLSTIIVADSLDCNMDRCLLPSKCCTISFAQVLWGIHHVLLKFIKATWSRRNAQQTISFCRMVEVFVGCHSDVDGLCRRLPHCHKLCGGLALDNGAAFLNFFANWLAGNNRHGKPSTKRGNCSNRFPSNGKSSLSSCMQTSRTNDTSPSSSSPSIGSRNGLEITALSQWLRRILGPMGWSCL